MLRRRSRKIKQKTTWKTDERKTENKKRPKNTKHEVFPTESVLKKWRVQKRRLKRGRTNYHFCNFSWEEKTRKKENIQRNISLFKRTNKQEKQFFFKQKKRPCKRKQFKKHGVLWTRRVCKRRKDKRREKRWSNRTESSEKEIHKKGSDRGQNNQEREFKKKNVQKHMRIEKRNFEKKKNKQTCKDK